MRKESDVDRAGLGTGERRPAENRTNMLHSIPVGPAIWSQSPDCRSVFVFRRPHSSTGFPLVNRQNIQVLLDEIKVEQVQAFMLAAGWELGDSEHDEVRAFVRTVEDGQQRLWIWNSTSHPKFRSRVQNLIFTLAVQHDREPIEIANEIYDATAPAEEQSAAPAAFAPVQIGIRNATDQDVELELSQPAPRSLVLASHEVVNLMIQDGRYLPVIDFAAGKISVQVENPAAVRLLTHLSYPPAGNDSLAAPDWTRWPWAGDPDQTRAKCEQAWDRAAFELSGLPRTEGYEKLVLKSVALLVVAIAQELAEDSAAPRMIWDFCRQLLAHHAIQLELYPGGEQQLWETTRFDRVAFPSNTLDWFSLHTHAQPT